MAEQQGRSLRCATKVCSMHLRGAKRAAKGRRGTRRAASLSQTSNRRAQCGQEATSTPRLPCGCRMQPCPGAEQPRGPTATMRAECPRTLAGSAGEAGLRASGETVTAGWSVLSAETCNRVSYCRTPCLVPLDAGILPPLAVVGWDCSHVVTWPCRSDE